MKSKKGLLFAWCWGALGKGLISCFLVVTMLSSLFIINVAADDSKISIYVNEKELQCDVQPYIENGRTMVPMRKIFEALGAEVAWDDATQAICAIKDDTIIILQINNSVLYKNDASELLDVAPAIVNDSTFVPIRAVSQSLNASVEWIEYPPAVYINSSNTYENNYRNYLDYIKTVTLMYAADGRTMYVPNSEVGTYQNVGWYLEPVTVMYAADGRTICVKLSEAEAYKNVGWYLEPVTLMYAADGRTMYVPNSEVGTYQNVGWYLEPVTVMYATDGRTICVKLSEAEVYKNVGWYLSPVITVYASDGGTMLIYEYELSDYLKAGWYKTYNEAQAAANSNPYNSSYQPSNNNQTNSGSNTTIKTSHQEHHFWAEEGVEIVSFDPLSSVVKYKDKCPVCGKVGNGTHTTSITGSRHNSNATCSNSKCSNKGKSFKVVIGHSTTTVDD